MLETLRISNYALIDQIEVDFHGGFNALSGETGAGKSILVGALNLVLGARASSESVRAGEDKARVEALFRLERIPARLATLLDEYGIALEEEALLLARSVSADGRSKGYAGGQLVPISVLAALGDELVDLHGQHEHQSLLKAECQLELLDGFGGTAETAAALAKEVARLRALDREIAALEADDRDRTRQLEFLRHEVREIEEAGFVPGEEEELRTRLKRVTNAEAVCEHASRICGVLYDAEEGSAVDAVDAALRELQALEAIDPRFEALSAQLTEARTQIEGVSVDVRGYTEALEVDPEELDSLNRRQALLSTMKRKYGGSIEEILAYRDKAAAELEGYEHRDERLAALAKEREALRTAAERAAAALSERRKKAARGLDKQVSAALQELGMKGARFETAFAAAPLSPRGVDKVVFELAANAGEPMKPLKQVASGGEVSRIMLALKSVFAQADAIPTLIFDEIDAGVGGAVARKVAAKMQELGKTHQVLCITHIAQIAASADAHFNVRKDTKQKRTATTVARVDADARVEEVARLLDGSLSEMSLAHARTLLAEN